MEESEVTKPEDWPRNWRELRLTEIYEALHEFINTPNFKTREKLLAFSSSYDLEQQNITGLWRVTDYEVALINEIYILGKAINSISTMVFLYEFISKTVHTKKLLSMAKYRTIDAHIYNYENYLCQPLKFYSYIYAIYLTDNNYSFGDKLIEIMTKIINQNEGQVSELKNILHTFQPMINDISYIHSKSIDEVWCFSRKQIRTIFKLQTKIFNIVGINPFESPYRGVLMTAISNYLLKSRNDYNSDFVVKYIDGKTIDKSLNNHQIWIHSIDTLNDPREGKVLPEIFQGESKWIKYSWAKNINFNLTRKYYLTCFSKSSSNGNMQTKYGHTFLGYKNDRISDDLCPIIVHRKNGKILPWLGQVIYFDVLYDKQKLKAELDLLFAIINDFKITDSKKHIFLEEILQYWIFSIKDSKWKDEQERRYLIFLYDEYEYIELTRDKDCLKIDTLLLTTPDYLVGYDGTKAKALFDNIGKYYISTANNNFYLCLNCLNRDFDDQAFKIDTCPVCGSKNIKLIKVV